MENNWLYNNLYWQWTLTPLSSMSTNVFRIRNFGNIATFYTNDTGNTSNPALFIKSESFINSGTGTIDNPYTLSL